MHGRHLPAVLRAALARGSSTQVRVTPRDRRYFALPPAAGALVARKAPASSTVVAYANNPFLSEEQEAKFAQAREAKAEARSWKSYADTADQAKWVSVAPATYFSLRGSYLSLALVPLATGISWIIEEVAVSKAKRWRRLEDEALATSGSKGTASSTVAEKTEEQLPPETPSDASFAEISLNSMSASGPLLALFVVGFGLFLAGRAAGRLNHSGRSAGRGPLLTSKEVSLFKPMT